MTVRPGSSYRTRDERLVVRIDERPLHQIHSALSGCVSALGSRCVRTAAVRSVYIRGEVATARCAPYIFTLTERASLSYSVRKIALSAGELLLLCSPPCGPLPLPIPLILDPRHCCVRELLYGPALGRLEPRGRVAVTRSPRAVALRAPGLPARPEPPLVEHLGVAAREVLDRWCRMQQTCGRAKKVGRCKDQPHACFEA